MSHEALTAQKTQTTSALNNAETLAIQEPVKEDIYKEGFERLPLQRKLSVGAPDDPLEDEADAVADRIMRMPEKSFIQRKCTDCENDQDPTIQRAFLPIQTKLTVGAVDDPLEDEADAMAGQVMRMPEESFIQRKCKHCEDDDEEQVQRMPLTSFIQKKQADGSGMVSNNVSNKILSTKGGGNTMPEATRSFMESRFGADFSAVKIHTGDYAAQLSNQLNAQAFTVGSDIYFNDGKFSPGSASGKSLLAHELTHTIQQGSSKTNIQNRVQRAPGDKPPAGKPTDNIGVSVVLDKDCSAMPEDDFKVFVMQLLLVQTFGIDYVTSVKLVAANNLQWSVWTGKHQRQKGTRIPVGMSKNFYKGILQKIYGPDDPRIETLVEANFSDTSGPVKPEVLKEQTKLLQLQDVKAKLTPLEQEFLKAKMLFKTGTAEQALATYRDLINRLPQLKKSLDWYAFLKTKLSAVEYYRTVAADFVQTQRLFHLIYTRQALQTQADPLNLYYKTNMAGVYNQYPWLKDVEAQLQADYVTYPSQSDGEALIKRELNLAGFQSLSQYEDFAKIFVGSFINVAAYKISQQLDVNEEIINKEKSFYTNTGASPIFQLFNPFKAEYEQIDKEHDANQSSFSNLGDGTQKFNAKLEELKARESAVDARVNKVREANQVGFPILEDKKLSNRELATQDSPALKKTLLDVTETRLGYITKTRANLAKSPEKFVITVADGKFIKLAKLEIGLDEGGFENFVIDGRISKVKADEGLEKTCMMALTIGLGLATLPFSGVAAVVVGIPGFALGIYNSVEEIKDYRIKKAAANTSFSPADAISNDDPSLAWLVVGLVGTALDGLILAKTFASLSKSRFLVNGIPEERFAEEVKEAILQEAPEISPAKLSKLLQTVDKKVEEGKELKTAFDKAIDKFWRRGGAPGRAYAIVHPVQLLIPPDRMEAILEIMYWGIRRGFNKFEKFMLEAKITNVEKQLLETTFQKALVRFQGKTALSPGEYQQFVLDMYKDFGYDVEKVFVRNKVTGTGAHLTYLKKPDGTVEFLELEGMTDQAKELISDMKAGGKDLQLGVGETEKIKDFSKVRTVDTPAKVLSDLPVINTILTDVEAVLEPVTGIKREARQLTSDLSKLRASGGSTTDITRLETMLAGQQKKLADTGTQLIGKANALEKEATLLTDADQKRKILQQVQSMREEGALLSYDIKVQDAFNLRNNLRKSLNTAGLFGNNAIYYNAHHVLPAEMIEESAVMRKAIEGGFDFNGVANGVNITQFSSKFRTENIVVEFIGDGKKANITIGGKVFKEAEIVDKGGGVQAFKIGENEVGNLTYTKHVKPDGSIIEGGTVEFTDNGVTTREILQESPLGGHASHPNYSLEIKNRLDAIEAKYPAGITKEKAAEEVNSLAKQVKEKILSSKDDPAFKIDNLFK